MNRREDGVGYQLGVDIGTTHTAAAVLRQGRAEIAVLGDRSAVIPSVVFIGGDEAVVIGDRASELGFSDPTRVARASKRRFGDPTPVVLGGTSYSADALMAKLLRSVVDLVSEREDGPPDLVAVTHPATWGAFRRDLLSTVIGLAGLESCRTLSDPEAAAIFHDSIEATAVGDVVAVYDLGGGTHDAAVLRKTTEGFEILGVPEGIDRLGGIDFDEAVLAHVSDAVGVAPADFMTDDPSTVAALARLREECSAVKEALSSDLEVSVPVFVPGGQTEVRLTRGELETMIRPALSQTIDALRRSLHTAHVEPADVSAVVLVGGSSRIPLVARLLSEEFGRPVEVAAHPKHAVALGAALSMSSWAMTHDPAPAHAPGAPPPPVTPIAPTEAPDGIVGPPAGVGPTSSVEPEAGVGPTATGPTVADPPTEAGASTDAAGPAEATGPTDGTTCSPAPAAVAVASAVADGQPPADGGSAEQPSPRRADPPAMSRLRSAAAGAASLAMIGAAVSAGALIAVGHVVAGVVVVVLAVAAGLALLLMVRRPADRAPDPSEPTERREDSSL